MGKYISQGVCVCFLFLWVIFGLGLIGLSCKKTDRFITTSTAILTTSVDTLKYDTVFTSVGSITKSLKIINPNKQKLLLNSIKLMGGNASFYKINVNGTAGTVLNNVVINANDSIYLFANLTINPTNALLPFVVRDSVQVTYNGNIRYIQLQAYGRNARFINNRTLTANTVWNNTLPYVVIGAFTIDTLATLTIQEGTKIYMHANAPIIVNGTVIANGKRWDSTQINITGDRLDAPYKDYTAAWPGIVFNPISKNNVLNYTTIQQAYQALIVGQPASNTSPKLTLNQCTINNAFDAGIIAINTSIVATNCLITNCGTNIGIVQGGNYTFHHCTIASYSNSNILHKNAVLNVTNYTKQGTTFTTNNLNAVFNNCIFWGDFGTVPTEVVADKQGTQPFNVTLTKCLYKANEPLSSFVTSISPIVNQPPLFDNISTSQNVYNFRLRPASPAINAANNSSVVIDILGNPRPVGTLPDIGCYEAQ